MRAEKADRGEHVYVADAARYDALTEPALTAAGLTAQRLADGRLSRCRTPRAQAVTRRMLGAAALYGKLLSILRLTKGVFTFDGGAGLHPLEDRAP